MHPTLQNGDTVVIKPKAYEKALPRVGDVIYARHPFKTQIRLVKRVHSITETKNLDVRGDNTESLSSTDSRSLGPLSPKLLLGQVVAKLPS